MKAMASSMGRTSRVARLRLLLLSVAVHATALLIAIWTIDSRFAGRVTGSASADSFSLTWIPNGGGGRGPVQDTVVPGDSTGMAGTDPTVETQRENPQKSFLAIVPTDPNSVFDPDSDNSITDDVDSKQTVQTRAEEVEFANAANQSHSKQSRSATANLETQPASNTGEKGTGDGLDTDEIRRGGNGAGGAGGSKGNGNSVSFFGIISKGRKVVYVIDASESMAQHNAMELARKELWSSLQDLPLTSQFQIVFFNVTNHVLSQSGDRAKLLAATTQNLRMAKQFLRGIHPDAGTDRLAAIILALSFEPDVVFVLTDAGDPELAAKDLWDIKRANKRSALIHVVEYGLGGDLSQDSFLKKLARQNGGKHHYHDLARDEQ